MLLLLLLLLFSKCYFFGFAVQFIQYKFAFTRPGVARAVLLKPLSFIILFCHPFVYNLEDTVYTKPEVL